MEIAPLHGTGSYAWTNRAGAAYHRMMRVAPLLLLVALTAAPVAAQVTRATRTDDFSRVLVITAHPDDEALLAPLLGSTCGTTSTCKLLVMSHGENSDCVFDDPCGPDSLGNMQLSELTTAAAMLHTELESWTLPDAFNDVADNWGGHDAVVTRLSAAIEAFHPSAIVTFDPAHGSTCHPAHRVLGQLVVDAAHERQVYFLEMRARVNDDDWYVFTRATTGASRLLFFDLASSWHFMADDMQAHTSQYTYRAIHAAYGSLDKTIVLMPAGATATYDTPCD